MSGTYPNTHSKTLPARALAQPAAEDLGSPLFPGPRVSVCRQGKRLNFLRAIVIGFGNKEPAASLPPRVHMPVHNCLAPRPEGPRVPRNVRGCPGLIKLLTKTCPKAWPLPIAPPRPSHLHPSTRAPTPSSRLSSRLSKQYGWHSSVQAGAMQPGWTRRRPVRRFHPVPTAAKISTTWFRCSPLCHRLNLRLKIQAPLQGSLDPVILPSLNG